MSDHWLPNVERRGLRGCVVSVNHIALIVSDVGRSLSFYTDVLGLQQIQRPNFDRHGAWLTAGNIEIHLIKGIPLVHTGENLIVNHIALDVEDPMEAFQGLKEMNIPFEVNVSVPKGEGKAESEGGGRGNTLSQAFLRDPDGYYIEMCNCNVLTDFVLGSSSYVSGCDSLVSSDLPFGKMSLYALIKMLALASRAKKKCRIRKATRRIEIEPLPVEEQPPRADHVILKNFLARQVVYGDICQSFSKAELEDLLRQAGNHAPKAQLLMKGRFLKGHKRLLHPPSYYVECNTGRRDMNRGESFKFVPEPFEEGRNGNLQNIMTAGLSSMHLTRELSDESLKAHDKTQDAANAASSKAAKAFGRINLPKLALKKKLSLHSFRRGHGQKNIPPNAKRVQPNILFHSKTPSNTSIVTSVTVEEYD